ncbi:uncharacterized protein C9orf43 homolog [Carlito syrichta]|uniref:Uncharacterized protein C9orf43 homolog n=1 Tax=Carlito syrichta TaxID=1868482 RepID=A0A3Q0E0W8_CARSF|nr:uncharacterized protein C9orf43 homolog [Carlito syrichta]
MDLPDESLWDETTCNSAVCQHPQCWATIRRIERGHPRILSSPCKTPLDTEDKLPALTTVNISDSCFAHHLSDFNISKSCSLSSRGSKFDSKFPGRSQKDLPGKSLINRAIRSSKLSVLNLNETQLPCSKDVRNMVVIWIPEEREKHMSPSEKHVLPSQHGKKKRKNLAVKNKSSWGLSRKEYTEKQLRIPGTVVPPPTPVHSSEQLHSDFMPFWAQFGMLPQDLLKEALSDGGKTVLSPQMKIQLAMMKKNLPLEKNRPDSAISSKMFLSIHRLTLQRPALRYPEHVKKLYNPKTEGYWKQRQQQQQKKAKTPTKKQEAKKKTKSDPESQGASRKHSVTIVYDPLSGYRTLPILKSAMNQKQKIELEGATLKQDSTERPKRDHSGKYVDFSFSVEGPGLSETELTNKDISAPVEAVLKEADEISSRLSESMAGISWNPELKLLRILQATDDDDEENQSSGSQSDAFLEE